MGAGASTNIDPKHFNQLKEFYESKKVEGITDEELFNQMKTYYDTLQIHDVLPPKSPRIEEVSPVVVTEAVVTTEILPNSPRI